jgi:gamma-D-glutamyl-L-lysine dipeptidyl-peptidase
MQFGISILSVIPIRELPSDKSEMTTQLIFGEHYKILEQRKKWSRIKIAHDKYTGWISNNQVHIIYQEEYDKLDKEIVTLTTDILDIIEGESNQPIVIGSVLPTYKSDHALIKNKMYKFLGKKTQGFSEKKHLVNNALIFLNTPYLWGGRTPFGIDCSGFTQIVYRLQGINIPRDAYQQAEVGNTLSFIEESEEGDLAFFDDSEGKITHVGIIMNNNNIIHASGKVRIDKLDQQGIFNIEKKIHTHKLRIIKSIV